MPTTFTYILRKGQQPPDLSRFPQDGDLLYLRPTVELDRSMGVTDGLCLDTPYTVANCRVGMTDAKVEFVELPKRWFSTVLFNRRREPTAADVVVSIDLRSSGSPLKADQWVEEQLTKLHRDGFSVGHTRLSHPKGKSFNLWLEVWKVRPKHQGPHPWEPRTNKPIYPPDLKNGFYWFRNRDEGDHLVFQYDDGAWLLPGQSDVVWPQEPVIDCWEYLGPVRGP